MAKDHVENLDAAAVPGVPWFPPGLPFRGQVRYLSRDPESGGFTGILELPSSIDSVSRLRTEAEIHIFVLSGTVDFDGRTQSTGGYCYFAAHSSMGRWRVLDELRAIIIVDSTPRFSALPGDSDGAHDSFFSVDSWRIPWVDPLEASGPSSPFRMGVCVKVLRIDPITGSSVHLAGLLPGWYMPGMEVHPVYEENYCLSGDVHISEVGDATGYTMTEGSFLCRPAGIAHGPIVSKNGNVNFVYAHGRLDIDYRDNPRSDALITTHLRNYPWR